MRTAMSIMVLIVPLVTTGQTTGPVTRDGAALRKGGFVELLGNGVYYSVNYERIFNNRFTDRLGIMVFPGKVSDANTIGIIDPETESHLIMVLAMISSLIGKSNHKLEIGAGFLGIYLPGFRAFRAIPGSFEIRPTVRLGYLYLPDRPGLTFRFAYTPLVRFAFPTPMGIRLAHKIGLAIGRVY